jgi:hypothetical protein
MKKIKKHLILNKTDAIIRKLIDEAWLSLVERCVRDAEVAGSNPVASIIKRRSTSLIERLVLFYAVCLVARRM